MITLAIVNARVWTGNPRKPWASGIAVDGDKIIVVASSAEVAKLVVESTRVLDAMGNTVSNPHGTIERGARADFVVSDTDSGSIDPDGESDLILKVTAGQVVFQRDQN